VPERSAARADGRLAAGRRAGGAVDLIDVTVGQPTAPSDGEMGEVHRFP
jgi:hypothetical protein